MSTWAEGEIALPLCVVTQVSPCCDGAAGLLVHVRAGHRVALASVSSQTALCNARHYC